MRETDSAYSMCPATVAEIDHINILHATMLDMRRAADGLTVKLVKGIGGWQSRFGYGISGDGKLSSF